MRHVDLVLNGKRSSKDSRCRDDALQLLSSAERSLRPSQVARLRVSTFEAPSLRYSSCPRFHMDCISRSVAGMSKFFARVNRNSCQFLQLSLNAKARQHVKRCLPLHALRISQSSLFSVYARAPLRSLASNFLDIFFAGNFSGYPTH